MALLSSPTSSPAETTGKVAMTREYKSTGGPFTFIIMRPDRSVRPLSGRNLHDSFCPVDQEGTVITGELDATITFKANWLANLLKRKLGEDTVGSYMHCGDKGQAYTFSEWLSSLQPEEGAEYYRCRISDKNMADEFVQSVTKHKDGRVFVEKAAYTFIRADSKFLNVNANGEHALKGSDGKVRHLYGEPSTWSVGTPGKMQRKCTSDPVPAELKDLTSLINTTMPDNEDTAAKEFCSNLIPAHVFVALFGSGFSESDGTINDSRLFVDDRERYTEFLATQTV